MHSVEIERIVQFFDETLSVTGFPDYPNALNGLQVEGPRSVSTVAAAVDASEATIQLAVELKADLLLVHHGLFWSGLQPLTGVLFRKLKAMVESRLALYSAHLPLDAHPELGNCAILARRAGLHIRGPFGTFKEREIGWWGTVDSSRDALSSHLEAVLGGEVRVIAGGPERLGRVGVVTGGGASFLTQAADQGLDALITGEASHHHYHDAMELGVSLFLCGHYATETWGVRGLAERAADELGIEWHFIDAPTGL